MGERPGARGPGEGGSERGLKGRSGDQPPQRPATAGGWRKACVQRRGDTAQLPQPLRGVEAGQGGVTAGPTDQKIAPGCHTNPKGIQANERGPKVDQGGLNRVPQGVPSSTGSLAAAPLDLQCPAPAAPYSTVNTVDSLLTDDSLFIYDDNCAAQAPDSDYSVNELGAVQELRVKPDKGCVDVEVSRGKRQLRKGNSNVSQSAVKSDSSKPSLTKNNSSRSTHVSIDSATLKNSNKASKTSPSSKKHSSLKTSPTRHASRKTSSSSSIQSKKISPVKNNRRSPCSSQSRNLSPANRKSKSPHSLRSKNHSPMNKTSHASHSSRSKNHSPARRTIRSPHLSRSKNRSPLKKTSQSPPSSHSKINFPKSRRSRPHLSNSRSPSLSKNNRLRLSQSRSHSPLRKSNRLPLLQSRSRSPQRRIRSFPSRSKSRSPLRTGRLHSTHSKSRSPVRNRRLKQPRSRSRSPLRQTSRLLSSRSKNPSPLKEGDRLHSSRSKSHSPLKKTSRLNTSISKSPIHLVSSLSSNSSPHSFGVRFDFTSELPDDKTLKEVIFQRFVKYGFVTDVQVHCSNSIRYVLVFYDEQHEQEEALIGAPKTRLFSKTIEVTPWTGGRVEDESGSSIWDDEMTKFSPASTRTLAIEKLPKAIAPEKLDNICVQFDNILDIEIKEEPGKATCSALVEFSSITSLIKVGKALNRKFFGTSHVNVTFSKRTPTNCLWLDGLPPNLSQDYLFLRFSEYGPVAKTLYNCSKDMALVAYKHDKDAVTAMKELKCGLGKLCGRRVMVDFASARFQLLFCQEMAASCQNTGDFLKE